MSVNYCHYCSEQLSHVAFIRSSYCEKPNCQRAKAQYYLDENKEKVIYEVTQEITSTCYNYLKHKNLPNDHILNKNVVATLSDPPSAHLAILPVNTRPLVSLSERRKQDFLKHLTTIYHDITEKRPSSTKVYATQIDKPLNKEDNELLGKACATCKGKCCNLGAEHAFQDTASLSYYLESQTGIANLEKLLQQYSQNFPIATYQNSCVFQGKVGCTLPLKLRSFTCKNYRCAELRSYHQKLIDSNSKITFAAGVKKDSIKQISIFDDQTFLMVKENSN